MSSKMSETKKELRPCPFCGISAKLIEKFIGDDVDSYWDVECTNYYCYLHGGSEWCFDTKSEAISKWNTRQPDWAHTYASNLFKALAPECDLLPDLLGVLTQIDNWCAGHRQPDKGLVEALEKIADIDACKGLSAREFASHSYGIATEILAKHKK